MRYKIQFYVIFFELFVSNDTFMGDFRVQLTRAARVLSKNLSSDSIEKYRLRKIFLNNMEESCYSLDKGPMCPKIYVLEGSLRDTVK